MHDSLIFGKLAAGLVMVRGEEHNDFESRIGGVEHYS